MITEEILDRIIKEARRQQKYEMKCSEAFGILYPDSYPPIVPNYLWGALATAVDSALGVTDFFDWWVWETDFGKDNAWIGLDGVRYPVTDVKEILAYAEAERKRKEGTE